MALRCRECYRQPFQGEVLVDTERKRAWLHSSLVVLGVTDTFIYGTVIESRESNAEKS